MKKIKALLYCCKAKPSLMKYENIDGYYTDTDPVLDKRALLNGKIVAECDFEVEEITYAPNPSAFERANFSPKEWGYDYQEKYGGLSNEELLKHSCLTNKELSDYFDLSNINWELAWEESQNSLCIKAWELWNKGYNITKISKILKLNQHTIITYLKRGNECGMCNYIPKK